MTKSPMTALNKQTLIAKIKKQIESFDTVVLKEDEANALLDELKSAENNLIDSECHVAELEESLRDKQALLESAEKRIAEHRKVLNSLAAVARRYLPDYDEHPEIQAADELLESTAGIGVKGE